MDKSLEWQQIYGAKEKERRSLPSRMDWRSNPGLKTSDLRGGVGGSERGAAAGLCTEESNFSEVEELPGRAGAITLKSLCST